MGTAAAMLALAPMPERMGEMKEWWCIIEYEFILPEF
jgi:hypothetical protein